MGRRQYLERLALGRSAFQDVDPEQRSTNTDTATSPATQIVTGLEYTQRYDSRGRPVNPDIEQFNAEQRKAQNEILALVGVVERKEEVDHSNGIRYEAIQKERQRLLEDEQARGELLEYAIYASSFLIHLWPDSFRQRLQIGLYGRDRPVADILSAEWHYMCSDGTRSSLSKRFPGALDNIAVATTRTLLTYGAGELTSKIQEWVLVSRFGRDSKKLLHQSVEWVLEILLLGIDVFLLPFEYHAATLRLGLAPALPPFPPRRSFLPAHYAGSLHSYAWRGAIGLRYLEQFTSPAALFILHKMVAYDAADSVLPVFHLVTDFRFPSADDDPTKATAPKVTQDPIGWVLYQCYSLRSSFLRRSGWTIVKRNNDSRRIHEYERGTRNVAEDEIKPVYRTTAMALLPAQFLSEAIDAFFTRLISLPFEALMMRTIAASYLAATGQSSSVSHLHAPFGGGPLMHGWRNFAQYAGSIGLSLALSAAADVFLFHGVYSAVKSIGTKHFDWGQKGKIGRIIYTEEGFGVHGGAGSVVENIH